MQKTDLAYAQTLDRKDKLALFKEQFVVDDPELIYLDGNSLGRLPHQTVKNLNEVINQQWGVDLIRGWNKNWISLQQKIGNKLSQLLGAKSGEIIIADSTSINLFKLALAALQVQPKRHKIITDDLNFPSDLYILQGILKLTDRPYQLEVLKSPDGIHGPIAALEAAIDEDTALVSLSHTVFKSSYTYPMAHITALAHKVGAITLWDMSHSAGSVAINLNEANADLAVGCTYKYLNGGPGSPAFLYIRKDWQNRLNNPISGWMGQNNMFDFALNYQPTTDISRFLTGTPPVVSLSAIENGVDLLLAAGMDRLRAKSVQQTDYFIALYDAWLTFLGFSLNTPLNSAHRGSHISLGHPEAWGISQALINDMNVLPDFRKPDNIRFGITPLYTSFVDIYNALHRLKTVMNERLYEKYKDTQAIVT